MRKLHPAQKQLLELLKETLEDPLTIREIQDEMEISTPSLVHHHIKQLEKKGYLRRNPTNSQDYQILASDPDKKIAYLNMYGLAQCGPRGSVLEGKPIERIPIATKILGFPSSEAFMVRAKGRSMIPMINDKDLVIAQKTNEIIGGSIVVCVNDAEALIKKIQYDGKKIILTSLNQEYKPFVAKTDFRVEGVVKGIYAYN